MSVTQITMTHFRQQSAIATVFSLPSGLIIGDVNGNIGAFGEDPNDRLIRQFIDYESGLEWMKSKCREYVGREDLDFLNREGTPLVRVAKPDLVRSRQ